MLVEIDERRMHSMLEAADTIYALFAFLQGQEDSYEAHREEWGQTIQFPQKKKPDAITAPSSEKEVVAEPKQEREKNSYAAFLKIYKKEFKNMQNKTKLKIEKALAAEPRFHSRVYEKRARINGVEIYGSASSQSECENRFLSDLVTKLELLTPAEGSARQKRYSKTITFAEWSAVWLEEVFKTSVGAYTYEREAKTFERHVLPAFGKIKLRDIALLDCMKFFQSLKSKGIERTAETCYGLMNRIFGFAVDNELLSKNPMAGMKPVKHERVNGVPLSKQEELELLAAVRGKEYEVMIVLALYSGLRPCELPSAKVAGEFVVAQNRKQKSAKVVFKKIPITPMLEPYRALLEQELPTRAAKFSKFMLDKTFKAAMPSHRLYDLRDTFATRCQECGVPETVVQAWMGHVPRTLLGKVYTKFSDDYLLSEGKKVKY